MNSFQVKKVKFKCAFTSNSHQGATHQLQKKVYRSLSILKSYLGNQTLIIGLKFNSLQCSVHFVNYAPC